MLESTDTATLEKRLAELGYAAQAFALSGLELPESITQEGLELMRELERRRKS